MYQVIIVDDEPVALANLCKIVEKSCPEYRVADTAEDGEEALEKILKKQPDLVLCDVCMPLMSGIELIKCVKEELPNLYFVLISGYQEFEYVQEAIRFGACDYILKPVTPRILQETLKKIEESLKVDYWKARSEVVHKVCNGQHCDERKITKVFPYEEYYCAIIRRNGLPRRYSLGIDNQEIYSDINEAVTIYGRDEMESLYLVPKELMFCKDFKEYMRILQKKEQQREQYTTVVYDPKCFQINVLSEKVKELYSYLDAVCIVGCNQLIDLSKKKMNKETRFSYDEINFVLVSLEHMAQKKQYDKLKNELQYLYELWEKEQKTQQWVEYMSRQILYIVHKYTSEMQSLIECEYMMEDAFYYAATAKNLRENMLDIIFGFLQKNENFPKVDSPEFFEGICKYLRQYLGENITLGDLCRHFGISQTYMGRLFRKYAGCSFNKYFTEMRLQEAKNLMRKNPELFIKDVAMMVGYRDQFYFSRIFRLYAGESPSDFLNGLERNGEKR